MHVPPASRSSDADRHAPAESAHARSHRIVDADAQLDAWNERRLREEALLRRRSPRSAAAGRGAPSIVAERPAGTLELATSAGAIASVVRQRGPDDPGGPAARRLAI